MKALDTFSRRLSRTFAVIASLTIALIMLLTVADVVRRSLTGRSIPGTTEFSEVFLVAAAFLGLAYAMRTGAHVAVDLVIERMPARAGRIIFTAGMVLALAVLVWMMFQTGNAALRSISAGEYRYGLIQVPIWPAKAVIPLALAALILECVVTLAKTWRSGTAEDGATEAGAEGRA
ncbi:MULTISPECIES: TRAP transporter small permease [Brevibacterium]|uniref:TRAP transporter small permease n=1 Tax=Brevibacterium salitolerans TaxID=1403566 RepID=A0ABN2WN26_9MICO|nr:TRAP transporter small permease [Brevibacterium sp.]